MYKKRCLKCVLPCWLDLQILVVCQELNVAPWFLCLPSSGEQDAVPFCEAEGGVHMPGGPTGADARVSLRLTGTTSWVPEALPMWTQRSSCSGEHPTASDACRRGGAVRKEQLVGISPPWPPCCWMVSKSSSYPRSEVEGDHMAKAHCLHNAQVSN